MFEEWNLKLCEERVCADALHEDMNIWYDNILLVFSIDEIHVFLWNFLWGNR